MKKKLNKPTSASNAALISHVSLALKSFNVQVSAYESTSILGDLKSLYKKKKYLFHIKNHLTVADIESVLFNASISWCGKNDHQFIIVAKSWDKELEVYHKKDTMSFKIICFNKLTTLGRDYMDTVERERIRNKERTSKEAWDKLKAS